MHISELSIRRPVATSMFFLAVVLIGVISYSRLAVDLFPSLSFPRLVVWTTYTNVSPEEVEQFISERIEQSLLRVPGVREIHSVSREGVSLVTVEFNWDADMEYAMLSVREKLDILRSQLPELASRPTILKADPNAEPIMNLAVSGRGGLHEIKGLADNVVKRRLEQIDGVALAAVTGGTDRQIRVEVNREIVESLGITLQQVQNALASANMMSMGGNINRGRFQWYLRPIGDFQTIEDIEQVVVVSRGSRLVKISDIGEVVDGFKERDNLTRFNSLESIGILIQKEAGSNTSQVSAKVRDVLDELETEYAGLDVAIAFDQAEFVNDSISNVIWAIALGGMFAFLLLFFFLHDIRNPLNIGLAIPISIIATFSLLYFAGITLNMMSLGGLALGVGLLVDNSIVVLENIFRHREEGEDRFEGAANGAREVAMAVTASTFTTISVFLPIIFVQGVAGQLFRDQALTVTFSLLASLIVSLTILPMLASRFLHMESFIKEKLEAGKAAEREAARMTEEAADLREGFRSPEKPAGSFKRILLVITWPFRKLWKLIRWVFRMVGGLMRSAGRILMLGSSSVLRSVSQATRRTTAPLFRGFDRAFEWFSNHYHNALEWSLDNRSRILAVCGVLILLALWIGYRLDKRLIPQVDQGEFNISMVLPAGSSLETTAEAAAVIEGWLLEMEEVQHVFMNAGLIRSESALGSQDSDINMATLRVRLKPKAKRNTFEIVSELRQRGTQLFGAELTFNTGETTFTEILGTSQADLAVKVRGLRLDVMQELAYRVEEQLGDVEGLRDINSDFAVGKPEIRLTVDRRVTEQYGLSVRAVVNMVSSTIKGNIATEFQDFDRKVEVLVREGEADRRTLQQILSMGLPIPASDGERIPLRELVDWRYTTGPNEVRREAQNRQITIFASVEGRRLDDAIAEVESLMLGMAVPDGYEIVVGGVNEEMRRSFRSLFFALGLAILLVYMILAAQFESLIHPFTIMSTVPLAVVGVVFALQIFGGGINIMSLVGMVVLTGIVVNDAIIKVDFINQLRDRGRPLRQAIVEAGHYRLRPIMMTTVTTVLGLTPLALGIGAGAELRSPLAVAVIGGLISATGLTLIVIPVVYSIMEGIRGESLGGRSTSFHPDGVTRHREVRL